MLSKEKVELFYARHHILLMFIPIFIFLLALGSIIHLYVQTGDFFHRDVSLRGGITATVTTEQPLDIVAVSRTLGSQAQVRRLADFTSGKQLGLIIEVSNIPADQLQTQLENILHITLTNKNYSVEETGPKLGESFYRQLVIALLFGFILMSISVFFTFKTFVPSIAVISAALMDIVIPLAFLNSIGFTISSAGLVAFLLVIGYSVDTDILLTTWTLRKREKPLFDRMWHSMHTGLTMTFAAMAVMIVGLVLSTSPVIHEIFFIIFLALITDIITTYLTNSGILWIYAKQKGIQ